MTNVSPVTTFSSQSSTAQLVTISQGNISLLSQTDSMSGYSSQDPLPALMSRDQILSSTILPHPSPRDQMLGQGNARPQLMSINRKDHMMSPPTSRGSLIWILFKTEFNSGYLLELLSPPVSQQLLSPLMSPHDVIISSPSQISSLSGELLVNSPVQLSSSHSKEDQISTIASQHQHHHHHHSSSVNKDQMMQSQCQSQPLMSPLLSPQVNHTPHHTISYHTTPHHIVYHIKTPNIFRTPCLCLPAWAETTWAP